MEIEKDTNAVQDAPQWVNVVVIGGDSIKLDYFEGMTVADVLKRANLEFKDGNVVQVNGVATALDQLVEPGSVVQLTTRVTNG